MNLKAMRNAHLYLGVFFAPLLLFFIVTGSLQTFNLHVGHKSDSYSPPQIIRSLAEIHQHQHLTYGKVNSGTSAPFRYLILLMAIGLIATTILGIIMAFKYTYPWLVWACLLGGVIIPCLLLWMR